MASNSIYQNLILNDDENIVKSIRQSKLRLIISLLLPIILVILPFFFLSVLFHWGNQGIIIFFLILAIGLLLLLRNYLIWHWRIFIITNQRIVDIDQQSLFKKTVSDIPLTKIQDVYYQIEGIIQTITKMGDVRITLIDSKIQIEVRNINKPQRIQQLILQLKAQTIKEKLDSTTLSAQELVALVKKIKAGIGEDKFNKIIGQRAKNQIEEN